MSDRPDRLRRDDQGRLHSYDGPALRWRDGYGLWAIHGSRLDERKILQPWEITHAEIADEPNSERRRVMAQLYGPRDKTTRDDDYDGTHLYLLDSGAELIDHDNGTRARVGSAPRLLVVDAQGARWMVCTDGSTGRIYTLRAPDDAHTCREAYQAITGVDGDRCVAEA